MAALLPFFALLLLLPAPSGAKDLRTKEQRLYAVKLRTAQWEVKRKELEFQIRQAEYEETRDLYAEHISTSEQLNQALAAHQQAKLAYEQAVITLEETRLSLLRGATHISIREARKIRTSADHHEVEITIENTSQLAPALALTPQQQPARLEELLALQDLVVSLRNPNGLIVAEPYQLDVARLGLGEAHTLRFSLLEDCQALVVAIHLPDGHTESAHIALRRETLQDLPQITSPQVSREAELNTKVSYQLILERLAEDDRAFGLATEGLPSEIGATFLDPATEAEVVQVQFGPQATRQHLTLELQLPEILGAHLLDQPLPFRVLALEPQTTHDLTQARRGAGGMAAPKGSSAAFELVPRGTGELELWSESRTQEIEPGQNGRFAVQLANTGSLDLEKVVLFTSVPSGWIAAVSPDTLAHLPAGDRLRLTLDLQAPAGVQGEYEFRLNAVGYAGRRRIEAPEKALGLRVEAPLDWRRGLGLSTVLLALLCGAIALSIRLRRR